MRAQLAAWAGAAPVAWSQAGATAATEPAAEAARPIVPFRGGYVGFFGYEAWRWLGPASTASELSTTRAAAAAAGGAAAAGCADGGAANQVDEAAFLFADRLLAFDHQEGKLHLLCLCEAKGESRRSAELWP